MSTGRTELNEFSVLSDPEEHIVAFAFFVMVPFCLALSFLMFILVSREVKLLGSDNPNIYYRKAIKCAWIASLSTVLLFLSDIFLCNDLIIGWDYTSSKHSFVTMSESFVWLFYQIIKLSFYFGFTFHFHSIIYSNKSEPLPLFLKFIMVFVAVYAIVMSIITIVDDALVNNSKEIGVTLKHNLYMTMMLSHEKKGFNILQLFALMSMVIDVSYFGILIYLYVSRLKQMDNASKQKGVKGLVLLITSCVFFWCFLIPIVLDLSYKYIASVMDIFADVLCLFLLFKSGTLIYDNLCGCLCHNCCGRMFFGENYKQLYGGDDSDEVRDNVDAEFERDSLLQI